MTTPIPSVLRRIAPVFSVSLALAIAGPGLLHAGSPAPAAASQSSGAPEHRALYPGTVTSGVKTSDAYTEGNFSIVAPVFSTLGADATLGGGLLFLEPYSSWGEGGEVATSLGLGYRHLFGDQSLSALTHHDGHQAGFW
ncbi:MAG: hypothetical protein ACAI34_17475 [Verrucomicrobium sp.]|nr:hypothetical protein [Verrucomicrobium sp.]